MRVHHNFKKKTSPLYNEKYLCLCAKINQRPGCQENPCNCFTTYMCGFTLYFWLGLIITIASIVGVIAYLSYNIFILNNNNNSYFANCTSNLNCNSAIGLYCSKDSNSKCKCPGTNTFNRCDCHAGYFWNGTYCQVLLDYLQTFCTNDYNCDTSKGLKCINKTCSCQKPKTWSSTLQICDYSFYGCNSDSSTYNAFLTLPSTTSFNGYFSETCIEKCYAYLFRFSIFTYGGTPKEFQCYCVNSFTISNTTGCSLMCPSNIITGGRFCGNVSSSNIRSVYYSS